MSDCAVRMCVTVSLKLPPLFISHDQRFQSDNFVAVYAAARGAFSNIDYVLSHLVHRVYTLIMQCNAKAKGHYSKKLSAFIRVRAHAASRAYSFCDYLLGSNA